MGVFYNSTIRLFGARAVPKEAGFWQEGGVWQVRVKKHEMVVLMCCSTVLALLDKFQAVTESRMTTGTLFAVLATSCLLASCSKIVRNVAISI